MLAVKDLDHLAARLHGRRSRLAEGPRLAALCGLGSPAALCAAALPGAGFSAPAELQRALVRGFVVETRWIAACLGGAWGDFAGWQAGRFSLLNLKTAMRGLSSGADRDSLAASLSGLPPAEGCGPELAAAAGVSALPELLPAGPLRDSLEKNLAEDRDLFLTEAALDRDHLAGLSAVCAALGGEDGASARGLAAQEAAAFNLMTAALGRFHHSYSKDDLAPLYAPGPAMDPRRFSRLLSAGSLSELGSLAAGSALDPGTPPPDISALEAAAWRRRYRLGGRVFRAAQTGAAAAAAYIYLRRAELANLASVSEGLRLGADPGELAARLIPRPEGPDA